MLSPPHLRYRLYGGYRGESSKATRQHGEAARKTQQRRFRGTGLTRKRKADMGVAEVREFCGVDGAGRSFLRVAMQQLGMSARSYHRILKLSRPLVDLEGSDDTETHHLAEAMQVRPRIGM
ncbi:MAG: ATP-binding protein [Anaerolineae bacterium]|nr:ATP-binding protein [Anaerolineae bacterium]